MAIEIKTPDQPLVHVDRLDTGVLTAEQKLNELYKEESAAIDTAYDNKINEYDTLYQNQIDDTNTWEKEQAKLQQEQTDFAIDQIEQKKAQAQKEYQQEQSVAYTDYQKQIDPYGVNAEQMAAMGMAGTGYSESAKVAMYNQYQRRVASAKASLSAATLAYDNMMKEAKRQNSSALAQLALDTYKQRTALAMEKLEYIDALLEEKATKKAELNEKYNEILAAILAEQEDPPKIDPTTDGAGILSGLLEGAITGVSVFEGGNSASTNVESASSSTEDNAPKQDLITAILDKVLEPFGIELAPTATPQEIEAKRREENEEKIANGEIPIDWESVRALGFGMMGAEQLDKLVREGKIEEYVEDGKLKFRKSLKFLLPQFNN